MILIPRHIMTPAAPIEEALNRQIADLIRKDGSNCHGCRRRFPHHDAGLTGHDAAGQLMLVGTCCSDRLASDVGARSIPLVEPVEGWREAGLAWFAAHPDRSRRVRPTLAGEEGMRNCVAVRQLQPGILQRVTIDLPFVIEETIEEVAHLHFDFLEEIQADGLTQITGAELQRRFRRLLAARVREGSA